MYTRRRLEVQKQPRKHSFHSVVEGGCGSERLLLVMQNIPKRVRAGVVNERRPKEIFFEGGEARTEIEEAVGKRICHRWCGEHGG